jgi:protein-tyrosine-phosphatase
MKILFICVGNVGRSQIAEAIFNNKQSHHTATSAGLNLSGPSQTLQELWPRTKEVLAVMSEEGIDISNARRKQLTEEMVNNADRVVVITKENEVELPNFLIHNPKLIRWDIPDLKGESLEFTRKAKDAIKEKINQLKKVI